MICISCNYEHDERFCPNCGEKSVVEKITFSSIIKDSLSIVINMDKGFLFNLKQLTINPHKIVTDYIIGKRKKIFNPISFLIISITIYLIGESFVINPIEKSDNDSQVYSLGYETGKFIFAYFKYFWILSIIWLGLSTKLLFGKYNYAEHVTISSFIIGYATLAGLIGYLIFKQSIIFNPLVYAVILCMIYQIFKDKNDKSESVILSFVSVALFIIQLITIVIGIGFIIRWVQ